MEKTTYFTLKKQAKVLEIEDGIVVFIPSSWVVDGEDRISYTTIIRLVECCREYHWLKDVKQKNKNLDSICGTLNSQFVKPIKVNSRVSIKYFIKDVAKKKYTLEFDVVDENDNMCCLIEMVSFFYDPIKQQSIEKPKGIFNIYR